MNRHEPRNSLFIHLGHHQLYITKKYQFFYTLNDFLIALWFLLGSICFLYENFQHFGTWLFILGSFQLLIRPMIRIVHEVHIKKIENKQQK